MAEIAVPTFESLDKFIRWWQTPAIRSLIENDPQVLSELGGHPNIALWVQRFMAQLRELHPSLSATPEAALRILTACTPEDRAAAETILYSCRENPEISEPAYTAKLASTGTIEGHETKPALFATLEKEDSLFAGTYQVIKRIGEGGMGAVYMANDLTLDIKVALKILKSDEFASQQEVERFLGEARSAARLNHPNIVRVYNAGVDERGRHYIAMQYVEGANLEKHLAVIRKEQSYRSTERELAGVFYLIAQSLAYAHSQGIIHRDIKPANILLDKGGTPYLADFGLAKRLDARTTGSRTASYAVMGTPWYMSPEQASGRTSTAAPESDIFSLGATMYHVFTGRAPFEAGSAYDVMKKILEEMPALPRSVRPGIPRDIDSIIMKCLHKNPCQRYTNADELASDLKAFLEDRPVSARPISSFARFAWQLKRRKALVAAFLVTVVAAVVIGVVLWRLGAARESEMREKRARESEKRDREAELARKRERAATLLAESRRAFEDGDFDRAIETVSSSLELDGDNEEAKKLKALCVTRVNERKRREEARRKAESIFRKLALAATLDQKLEVLNRAISADPSWLSPCVEKGKALKRTSRVDRALAAFRHALQVAEKNGDTEGRAVVHFEMGQIYWDTSDYKKAQECFEKVLELMPDVRNPRTMFAQAIRAYKDSRYDECIRLLEEALGLQPDMAEVYNILGWAYRLKGDYKNALANFEKALEFKPEDAYSHINRGITRNGLGDHDGAVEDYTRAIEIAEAADNRNALTSALSNRGAAFKWKGELDKALEDLDRSIELDAENASGYHNRAVVRCALHDLGGAMEDHNRAIELRPQDASFYNGRGATLRAKGDFKGAIADYHKAIDLDKQYVEPYYNLGYAHYAIGENQSAIGCWKKAIEFQPALWQAWNALGVVYKNQKEYDKAIEAFGNVVKIVPNHVSALENSALLLWGAARYKESASHYLHLARVVRNDSVKWYSAAVALAKAGEKDDAVRALGAAFEFDATGRIKDHASTNPELESLRSIPAFQRLFSE